MDFSWILVAAIPYLIGSIPFGLLLLRFFAKTDIRAIGSGNIGATNVLRSGKKFLALVTLLLDGLKGSIAATLITGIPEKFESGRMAGHPFLEHEIVLSLGLLAIIGHCFPVWLKFKGGKGVATAFGVLIAAVPFAALVAATTWGIVVGFFRISSAGALAAAAIAPLATLLIYGAMPAVITLLITLLIFARHKDNIKRLMTGEEPKIGAKKGSDEPASTQH